MGAGDLARAAFAFTGELPPGGDDPCMPHPACGNRTLGAHVCSCNWQKARKGCNDEETESGVLGGNLWPSLATRIEMGAVRPGTPHRAGVLLSVDDLGHSARFFRKTLPEYWRRNGLTWSDMALNASDDFEALVAACERFDADLVTELFEAGGEDYAVVASAAYRGTLARSSLVWYDGDLHGRKTATGAGAFWFVKGFGASGDTGTVDDLYRPAPFHLWKNPELLNALLRPLNMFTSRQTYDPLGGYPLNVSYPHRFSCHYLGQYPIAEMQVK